MPHARAQANLRAAASARGVAAERLVFAPHVAQPAHLARLRCADLALDVLPYGSHTTGSDALWAGVPLLTCLGQHVRRPRRREPRRCRRVAVVRRRTSVAAYRARLSDLLARRDELAAARAHLERGRIALPLFDTETFTRDFERLLVAAADGSVATSGAARGVRFGRERRSAAVLDQLDLVAVGVLARTR